MSSRRKRSLTRESESAAREVVIATARAMSRRGLSPGRSGNVSRRWGEGMLITPSGVTYDALTPEDIAFVGANGRFERSANPSSEWRFHLSAYAARPDRSAVVHTHSLNATALACAHRPIPAFHYMVAVVGGSGIPVVPYATFGTEELADHVASGLAGRGDACLMANHGVIALGETPAAALELAAEVETLAATYIKVLTLGGPFVLDETEMKAVLARFRTYGRNAKGAKRSRT